MDDNRVAPTRRDVVVVGASAGGVEAVTRLARSLPADLRAAVLICLHVPSVGPSALPQILRRNGPLPAEHATDNQLLEPGRIYIAPPNLHLLVEGDRLRLSAGARENGHRPAVDPMFRSAACSLGARVIGVVLSGVLDDGAAGLRAIKNAGGVAVVQDLDDATYPAMPANAMAATAVDEVLTVEQIAEFIVRSSGQLGPGHDGGEAPAVVDAEGASARLDPPAPDVDATPGSPSRRRRRPGTRRSSVAC